VGVGGIQVTNLPDWQNGQALGSQFVTVWVKLHRWNPTSRTWQYIAYRAWQSPNQREIFGVNYMKVPNVNFNLSAPGYYSVTVEAYWDYVGVRMAYRAASLNSATDYAIFDRAVAYSGSCYIY
jgi:hypothetical protein